MEGDAHNRDAEAQEVGVPIEIHGESPHFVLHPGQGRVELFTRTENGILIFATIKFVLADTGEGKKCSRLMMTNETGSHSMEVNRCSTQIGRLLTGEFFRGYAGDHLSGNHCEVAFHFRDFDDAEISIKNRVPPPTNGTYYKYYDK